jgi:hypothetical protein
VPDIAGTSIHTCTVIPNSEYAGYVCKTMYYCKRGIFLRPQEVAEKDPGEFRNYK